MPKNQDKIKAALDRIEDGLAAINSDENWLSYLCFQSKFYNYSFRNTMLMLFREELDVGNVGLHLRDGVIISQVEITLYLDLWKTHRK